MDEVEAEYNNYWETKRFYEELDRSVLFLFIPQILMGILKCKVSLLLVMKQGKPLFCLVLSNGEIESESSVSQLIVFLKLVSLVYFSQTNLVFN